MIARRLLMVAAAGGDWWLAGGISASNAKAVYQPIGAVSLAASYTDLSGNGNDAAPGTAPTFASSTGWTFNGSSQYLTTGVTPAVGSTLLIRFSNSTTGGTDALAGTFGGGSNYVIYNATTVGYLFRYLDGQTFVGSDLVGDYVITMASNTGYLDGASVATITTSIGTTPSGPMFVGAYRDFTTGNPAGYYIGNILAVAYYDTVLTGDQVVAVSTAAAALTG